MQDFTFTSLAQANCSIALLFRDSEVPSSESYMIFIIYFRIRSAFEVYSTIWILNPRILPSSGPSAATLQLSGHVHDSCLPLPFLRFPFPPIVRRNATTDQNVIHLNVGLLCYRVAPVFFALFGAFFALLPAFSTHTQTYFFDHHEYPLRFRRAACQLSISFILRREASRAKGRRCFLK